MNMRGETIYTIGVAMISGAIFMNKDTFITAVKYVHDALYKISLPEDNSKYVILSTLIDGYIAMLAEFNDEAYRYIYEFLLTHTVLDEQLVGLLYDYIYSENSALQN